MSSKETAHKSRVPMLQKRGIAQWKKKFTGYLRRFNSANLALATARPAANVQGGEARALWDSRNNVAISYLEEAVSETENADGERIVLDAVDEGKTCTEVLTLLENKYKMVGTKFVRAATKRFNTCVISPTETAESFINRILALKCDLHDLGKEVDLDDDCLGVLLSSLENEARFEVAAAAISTNEDMNWEKATTILLTAELSGDTSTSATSTKEHAKSATNIPRTHSGQQATLRCQICQKPNHSADKCHFRFKSDTQGNKIHTSRTNNGATTKKKDNSRIECFNCHKKGHYANKCPEQKRGKKDKAKNSAAWDSDEHAAMMQERDEE